MNNESESDGSDEGVENENEEENPGDYHGQEYSAARGEEPPAAAAAARPAESSLLEQLMERIRNFLSGVGAEPDAEIDEDQARRLLEASAGDLDVVTSLYCDHYFASLDSHRNDRRPAEEDEEDTPRRVRRRLEEQLDEHADDNAGDDNMEDQNDEADDDEASDEDADAPAEMPPPAQPENRHGAGARNAALVQDGNNEEGHEISDDEGPQRPSRRSRRRVRIERQDQDEPDVPGGAPLLRNISENMEHDAQNDEVGVSLSHDTLPLKEEEDDEEEEYDDDIDDDFLSDHDWIFGDDSNASRVTPPVALLWGDLSGSSEPASEANGNADNAPAVAEEAASNVPSNVVAEDDDGDDAAPAASPTEGIPKTWIHAGFTASSCRTGLVTLPPKDEENALFRWRQSQHSGSRNIAPPPYHCRGVTALLSIVTALIYSGASIQGSTVDCTAARTPFAELSESDRKLEFDARLVDALSSLVLVAAKASLERKKSALAKRRQISPPGSGDDDKLRQQNLKRKLRLIPTCRFEDDTGTGDGSVVEGQQVQIATSFTSIEQIRSYVLSTVRSFSKKGGCALFLETIIRIHGKACVERMLRTSRRKAGLPSTKVLIKCECEKRQKKLQQWSLTSVEGSNNEPVEEALPLDHSCITTELVSLLLTGEVHSDFQGWSTGTLGIGLLTNTPGEVGRKLMRPQKPVWLLRGDTCFSVLWLDGTKEHAESFSHGDLPGTEVFRLSHWNSWFGDRHKSGMRIITARGEWSPPVISKVGAARTSNRKTVSDLIMARRKEQSNIVSSDEHGEEEMTSTGQTITKGEIDRLRVHPDDEKLYPNNYRQWRFDMGKTTTDSKVKAEDDVKMGPVSGCGKDHWTPYFRLDDRQQMIVEMKMSPKIKRILWTRWPGAAIDRFTPDDDETPPAV